MRYLTTEQIKAYCRNELPTEDDEFFEQAGNHAEQTLDRACQRRFFVAGTTATTRVYVPNSETRLRIHDAVEVTTILNNGTPVTAGIQLMPLNGVTWAGEARPYEEIELTSGQWWYRDGKEATATVTARWGWASIPDSIQQAALIIAKEIITNRDEVKLGLVGFSDVGGVVARTNPIVRGVIADYRRVESFGIG